MTILAIAAIFIVLLGPVFVSALRSKPDVDYLNPKNCEDFDT